MKLREAQTNGGCLASGSLGGERRHQVYRDLKMRALLYRFRPGQHLAVIELSDQLRVSNTPVREALIRLHAENLVAAIPSRGFFARELRLREMHELHDLLQVLLRHSLNSPLGGPALPQKRQDAAAKPPPVSCDPRTALALARRTEAVFLAIAGGKRNDVLDRSVSDLCERTHHIRRCAYRSAALTGSLQTSLAALIAAVATSDGVAMSAALDDYFGLVNEALPDLVMRALATSLTFETG